MNGLKILLIALLIVLLTGCVQKTPEVTITNITLSENYNSANPYLTLTYTSNSDFVTIIGIDTDIIGIVNIKKGQNSFDFPVPSKKFIGKHITNTVILYDPSNSQVMKWFYQINLYSIGVR
jgi:hypothetical protein